VCRASGTITRCPGSGPPPTRTVTRPGSAGWAPACSRSRRTSSTRASATFLVGTALVCLVLAGKTTWELTSDFSEQPILDLLDILLLVFIVVELLFAVRSTVEKRELLAEPFLLVGIIASIKEIVVLSVESAKEVGNGAQFDDRITEIAVLGVLILFLGLTSWLLRRKEREPDEGDSSPPAPERQVN
jgi:uncharacterized membrane protein (DUF373 family)